VHHGSVSRQKNVPLYVEHQHDICSDDQPYDPDEMLYGRFLYFAQVETAWNVGQGDQPLIFGYCRLFRRLKLDDESRWTTADQIIIDIAKPLQYVDQSKANNPAYVGYSKMREIEWVQLKHVEGMLAVGPVYPGEIDRGWRQRDFMRNNGAACVTSCNTV